VTTPLVADTLVVFVPCRLVNPLNGSHGHWSTSAKRVRRHKEATYAVIWSALRNPQGAGRVLWRITAKPETPKRVAFVFHVARRFDPDALPAIAKPFLDALQAPGVRLIHSDGPDSGHVVTYAQVTGYTPHGVEITVALA